jgi:hypothetical protein
MKRLLALAGVMGTAAAIASPAVAAIFIHLATLHVHRGGSLRIVGNAAHLPLYALPVRRMPCIKSGTCSGEPIHRATAPRRPFIFLGRAPGGAGGRTTTRTFTLRLPQGLPAGRYVVFVWCASCAGSLISAGTNPTGQPQTLDVLPEGYLPTMRVGSDVTVARPAPFQAATRTRIWWPASFFLSL